MEAGPGCAYVGIVAGERGELGVRKAVSVIVAMWVGILSEFCELA
jgi:hypothetical protein